MQASTLRTARQRLRQFQLFPASHFPSTSFPRISFHPILPLSTSRLYRQDLRTPRANLDHPVQVTSLATSTPHLASPPASTPPTTPAPFQIPNDPSPSLLPMHRVQHHHSLIPKDLSRTLAISAQQPAVGAHPYPVQTLLFPPVHQLNKHSFNSVKHSAKIQLLILIQTLLLLDQRRVDRLLRLVKVRVVVVE